MLSLLNWDVTLLLYGKGCCILPALTGLHDPSLHRVLEQSLSLGLLMHYVSLAAGSHESRSCATCHGQLPCETSLCLPSGVML